MMRVMYLANRDQSGFRLPLPRKAAAVLLLLASLGFAGSAKKVAVQDFSSVSNSLKAGEGELLGDALREGMDGLPTASFVLMTRENITELLPPGKTLEECSEGQCEVEIGRKLGADYLVIGKVLRVDKQLVATVKVHRIQPVGVLLTRQVRAKSIGDLLSAVTTLGREVQGKLLGAESVVRETGPSPEATSLAAGASKRIAKFTSVPAGAAVAVDGNPVGTTPCSKALLEGDHAVAMALDGYHSQKKVVKLAINGQEIGFVLATIQTRLSLDAVDDRTGDALVADVYVDGSKVGQTPYDGLVAVSSQRIEVAPQGFDRKSVRVSLEEGLVASATAHFMSAEKSKAVGIPSRLAQTKDGVSDSQNGSFTDRRDGQVYKWVKIGDQTWMAQNLNFKTGKSWCFDNDADNCRKYGRLYDWETAKNACPEGWHLPDDDEWYSLQIAVGGDGGRKLKSAIWLGTDALGFSALPAGARTAEGTFYDHGYLASFWSSSDHGPDKAWVRNLVSTGDGIDRFDHEKKYGHSVRCRQSRIRIPFA